MSAWRATAQGVIVTCRLIAQTAGAPVSRARVTAGAKSRLKQISVEGDAEALMGALARLLE